MELTTHPRKLSRWRILPTMSSRGSWKVPVTVQSPGFGTSQSTRRMAGHWACLFGLTTTREAWLTRRHSLAPLEPDAIMHQVHRFEICVLLGGRTGDGSCLGPVRPRPLDGPFGPSRAGALAPFSQCRRQEPFRGPDFNPASHPASYGDWMIFGRRHPKTSAATPFWRCMVRSIRSPTPPQQNNFERPGEETTGDIVIRLCPAGFCQTSLCHD